METTLSALITETEASRILSVSKAALRRWRREHRGPSFLKIERVVRYDPGALKDFLEQRCSGKRSDLAGDNSTAKKKAADSRSAARKAVRHGHATTSTI
jgi:hypothetical protein